MKQILLALVFLPQIVIAQSRFRAAAPGDLPGGAIGGNSMDVRVADFNGDGFPDIVLAKEFNRNRILFNDGKGVFTDGSTGRFVNALRDSEDIAIADFDGNGWPDVIFAAEDDSAHSLYFNTAGVFTEESSRLPQFISNAVLAFDVNGDNHPDLIFGNEGQNRIFINDGSGAFSDETASRLPALNNTTQDLLLVDVDKDGDMDLVAGNEDGNRLLINNGSGVFADQSSTRLPQGLNMETRKIVSGDVDGDGFPDLFVCNMASVAGRDIRDRLYLNDGSGVFSDVTLTHLPAEQLHTFDAIFADLNGDGSQDLIVGYMGAEMPAVFINDGRGFFSDSTTTYLPASAAGNTIGMTLADLNGDAAQDLYLARFQQSDALFLRSGPATGVGTAGTAAFTLHAFPEPATSVLHLELNAVAGHSYQIQLLDAAGRQILCETLSGRVKRFVIPVSGFPAGSYLVQVSDGRSMISKQVAVRH